MHLKAGRWSRHASEETLGFQGCCDQCVKWGLPGFLVEKAAPESRTGRKYFHSESHHNCLDPTKKQ